MDDIPPIELQVILEHIYAGHKIEAVKHYKELRGVSLVEAKQFIDKLTDELRAQSPEKFVSTSKSGCLGAVAMWISLGGFAAGLSMLAIWFTQMIKN